MRASTTQPEEEFQSQAFSWNSLLNSLVVHLKPKGNISFLPSTTYAYLEELHICKVWIDSNLLTLDLLSIYLVSYRK